MGHKKKHEEHVNHERWLVSYADFITLLFATFTALFAISNADKEKFKAAATSLKNAFATDIPTDVSRVGLKGRGLKDHSKVGTQNIFKDTRRASGSRINLSSGDHPSGHPDTTAAGGEAPEIGVVKSRGPEPESEPGSTVAGDPAASDPGDQNPGKGGNDPSKDGGGSGKSSWAEQAETRMNELIEHNNLGSSTHIRHDKRGLVISLSEDGYFEPEATDVKPEALHKLDKILKVLQNDGYKSVSVEAHTDNAPLQSGIYRNALDLTTQRAARVFEYMVQNYGFSPESISPIGFGGYRPIDTNDTDWGRRRNRRVDLVIINPEEARTP